MNTPISPVSPTKDLVISIVGGDRDGQLLPIPNEKFLVSSLVADPAIGEQYRCAIFRGEKGVAFRSYNELVTLNGQQASVHWLRVGDRIDLANHLSVVVQQLGVFEKSPTVPPSPQAAAPATTAPATPQPTAPKALEPNITDANSQHLDSLASRLSTLVDVAAGASAPAVGVAPSPDGSTGAGQGGSVAGVDVAALSRSGGSTTAPTASGTGAASSANAASIQNYLDKALGGDSPATTTPAPATVAAPVRPVTATLPTTSNDNVANVLDGLLGNASSATQPPTTPPTTEAPAPAQPAPDQLQPTPTLQMDSNSDQSYLQSEAQPLDSPQPTDNQLNNATPPAGESSVESPTGLGLLESLGFDAAELGLKPGDHRPLLDSAPQHEPAEESIQSPIVQPLEEEPAAEPVKQESVAEVLARMNAVTSQTAPAPTAEPAASDSIANLMTAAAQPQPVEAPTNSGQAKVASQPKGGEEDGDVEEYMSQLLNRMRGDDDAPSSAAVETEEPTESPAVVESVPTPASAGTEAAPEETLAPDEFKPKQRAVRMESLDSLREIANETARLAIQDSFAKQRRVSTQTKLLIGLSSLGFAIVFFAMSLLIGKTINIPGMICGLFFVVIGIVAWNLYCKERKLDDSIISD